MSDIFEHLPGGRAQFIAMVREMVGTPSNLHHLPRWEVREPGDKAHMAISFSHGSTSFAMIWRTQILRINLARATHSLHAVSHLAARECPAGANRKYSLARVPMLRG